MCVQTAGPGAVSLQGEVCGAAEQREGAGRAIRHSGGGALPPEQTIRRGPEQHQLTVPGVCEIERARERETKALFTQEKYLDSTTFFQNLDCFLTQTFICLHRAQHAHNHLSLFTRRGS